MGRQTGEGFLRKGAHELGIAGAYAGCTRVAERAPGLLVGPSACRLISAVGGGRTV